ncbi:YlxR family protein [Nocardioides sp. HDW12B]|uniref:YlxR family protein n=1 Tax=Nocardioides sp. HDW12B TaxID=2714939 RepID=UPI00140787E7|nr:YlxR family protein [Nocardioides sp. HDW12B]QIK66939.1 YlxR family protein [Nocardioides sp. HDW12B]
MTSSPVRTCVGCRRRAAKTDLLRVVAEDQGHGLVLVPDPPARRPGRGAYLHPDEDCLAQALRRRAFPRALRITSGAGGGTDDTGLRRHVQQWSGRSTPA